MEIPALFYFSCWSLISITCLKLGFGFIALEREDSQISPLIIFLLKRFLAVYVCHSSTYALVHRSGANRTSLVNHFKLSILGFPFLFYVFSSFGPLPLRFVLCYAFVVTTIFSLITTVEAGLCVDFIVRSITFSLKVEDNAFYPIFVLVVAFFTAAVAGRISSDQNRFDRDISPVQSLWAYPKKRKIVALIVASVGFRMLVRFESWTHVLAFLWFVVAWLGCVSSTTIRRFERGLFDILVSNVVAGCWNRFGLSGPTWLAFGICIVLSTLHSELKAVRFVRARDVVSW